MEDIYIFLNYIKNNLHFTQGQQSITEDDFFRLGNDSL